MIEDFGTLFPETATPFLAINGQRRPMIDTRPGRCSAGVFAVLITVLVLELRPPELPTFKALLLLWPT